MDGSDAKILGVALVLPEGGGAPGLAHGAAHLANWIAGDPRMALVSVARAPVPHARGLAARIMRAEARLRRPAPPAPLPAPVGGAADVVVDLTGGAARPTALHPAAPPRFGLWRLSAHAPGAGFAEVAGGAPVTQVTLTAELGGRAVPIGRATYGIKPLAGINAAFIGEKSVQLVCRALAELHLSGALPPALDPSGAPGGGAAPGGLVAYGARALPRLAGRAGAKLGRWTGTRGPAFALRLCAGGPLDFDPVSGTTLLPPKGHFWADPFLHANGDALHLFYEDYDASVGRGLLKVARLDGEAMKVLGEPLRAPHHLSYPFVFDAEGETWMIPETTAARRVEVWRATDYPLGWERAATALEGRAAADSVLLRHGGAWWFFTNISHDSFGDHCSELHLFRADGPLLRHLDPHPLNPVVIDATTARGGGRVWAVGGRLYRASQDNSHGVYGWGLNVMEITRLDMQGYAERRLRLVSPLTVPGLRACHHMDFTAGHVVIDARLAP